MVLLSLHAHLNCIFAHFILFNDRFKLIDEKETEILHDLVVALELHPDADAGEPTVSSSDSATEAGVRVDVDAVCASAVDKQTFGGEGRGAATTDPTVTEDARPPPDDPGTNAADAGP